MKETAFAQFAGNDGEKLMVMQYLRDDGMAKEKAKWKVDDHRDKVAGIVTKSIVAAGLLTMCQLTIPAAIIGGAVALIGEGARFLEDQSAKQKAYKTVKREAQRHQRSQKPKVAPTPS